jgi:hypothetical protein
MNFIASSLLGGHIADSPFQRQQLIPRERGALAHFRVVQWPASVERSRGKGVLLFDAQAILQ